MPPRNVSGEVFAGLEARKTVVHSGRGLLFFFSSRRRHTRFDCDWSSDVCSSDLRDNEVILFDNAGVSSSSGEVPTTFEQMGANAIAFIKALGLKQVDILGFSIGGDRKSVV